MDAIMEEARSGSLEDSAEKGTSGQRATQLRVDAKTFQPAASGAVRGLQGLPKVHVRRPTLVNLDAVPFTPSQGIATPTPLAASAMWYNQQLHLFGDPGSASRGYYYWGVANPADLSTADSSSGHSDATRYNSDSDRSPTVQSYSPMWTLTPQLPGQEGSYVSMPADPNSNVGFAYGPPAVPFASYATYQGALYPFLSAQRPGPMAGSIPQPPPGYNPMFIAVSPVAHKAGSPHGPPMLFASPFAAPPEGAGGFPTQWGPNLPSGSPPTPHGDRRQPRERRRSHLGPSPPPDAHSFHAAVPGPHPPPVADYPRPDTASPPREPWTLHAAGPSHSQQQQQQQPPPHKGAEHRPLSSPEQLMGPDGQPLKLNARQRRTLRRAAARQALADAEAQEQAEALPQGSQAMDTSSSSPGQRSQLLEASLDPHPGRRASAEISSPSPGNGAVSSDPRTGQEAGLPWGQRRANTAAVQEVRHKEQPSARASAQDTKTSAVPAAHSAPQQQEDNEKPRVPMPILLGPHRRPVHVEVHATATTTMTKAPRVPQQLPSDQTS